MKIILKSRQNGFAIIEALIAFLLLGIGVAALIYLQGNLMSGSSISKARAEAMELAKDRTEILRNNIHREQYLSALGSVPDESVTGVNAAYTVSYTVLQNNDDDPPVLLPIDGGNPLTTDKTQNLTVKVSWEGSDENSEEVSLETMLYFMSPVIVSAIDDPDSDGEGDLPPLLAPWIAGKEGMDPNPPPSSGFDPSEDILLRENPDDPTSAALIIVNFKTYYNDVDGVTSYSNVEVIVDGKVKLTSFGGIVHKLQGEIIIDSGANTTLGLLTDDLKILASPPSYCVFPICEGSVLVDGVLECPAGTNRAKYVCYVPGDCTYQDKYSTDLEGCPPGFVPPADDNFEDLNGGWYGRVGNFGVAIHPDDKVCTFETDISPPKVNLTPSRSYVRYRWAVVAGVNQIIANEGINTPYSNQNFLITRKNANCFTAAENLSVPVSLITSQIEGPLLNGMKVFNADGTPNDTDPWDKNVVLPENFCDVYTDPDGDGVFDTHDPSCPTPTP